MSKSIVKRLSDARFKVFDATPYPAVIVPYDMDDDAACRSLIEIVPDVVASRDNSNGLCNFFSHIEGYSMVFVGVRWSCRKKHAVLAHECLHALNIIYSWFGVKHDVDNDEYSTYMLEYIYDECIKALEGGE